VVEKMVSVGEAAEVVGVHPKTLGRLIRNGEVPAVRVGRQWRIRLSDLEPGYQAPRKAAAKREPTGTFTRIAAELP
jgi:excisionase family DNA binding protein